MPASGTITLVSGSATVVGVGTDFLAEADKGYLLRDRATAQVYPVLSIQDATHLTLDDNVLAAAAGAGRVFSFIATSEPVRALTKDVGELLGDFSDVRDGPGQGAFTDKVLESRATDAGPNTRATHLRMSRGNGGGTNVSLRSVGTAANDISQVEWAFDGANCFSFLKNGAFYQASVDAAVDPEIIAYRPTSGVGVGIGRKSSYGHDSSGTFRCYGYEQVEINDSTAGAHFGRHVTSIAKGGVTFQSQMLVADEHRIFGGAPYYSLYNQAGTSRLGYMQAVGGNLSLVSETGLISLIAPSGVAPDGTAVASISRTAGSGGTIFYVGLGSSGNGAAATMRVNAQLSNGRGITSGGSINASGADYAEYHRKAPLCGTVLKGQIVGLNPKREIVDRWADAVRFKIKSTDPNLVGGDRWFPVPRPERPEAPPEPVYAGREKPLENDPLYDLRLVAWDNDQVAHAAALEAWEAAKAEQLAEHEAALADWTEAHEAARVTVDRLAYAGQVPAILTGPVVLGDYVVAVDDGEGGIIAICVAEPTPAERRRVVGYVAVADPTEDDIGALIDLTKVPLDPAWNAIIDVMQS